MARAALVTPAEDVDMVAAELESIAAANGGVLNPSQVVKFARDAQTALHGCFCWDDTVAAKKYRLIQAESLIRTRVTILPTSSEETRVWVSLDPDRNADGGYRRINNVLSNEEQRACLLEQAKRELASFRRKYSVLSELAKVWGAIDEAV